MTFTCQSQLNIEHVTARVDAVSHSFSRRSPLQPQPPQLYHRAPLRPPFPLSMLDQLYGRPSISYKRTQVFLVLLFWLHRLLRGDPRPPPLPFFRSLNRVAQKRFTPWQIVLSTLVSLYAIKHSDALLGLQAPEPLSRLYSKSYYRATWIVTALDAGFATAMEIKPKWLRDIFSVAFSGYYLFFASEADEKVRSLSLSLSLLVFARTSSFHSPDRAPLRRPIRIELT